MSRRALAMLVAAPLVLASPARADFASSIDFSARLDRDGLRSTGFPMRAAPALEWNDRVARLYADGLALSAEGNIHVRASRANGRIALGSVRNLFPELVVAAIHDDPLDDPARDAVRGGVRLARGNAFRGLWAGAGAQRSSADGGVSAPLFEIGAWKRAGEISVSATIEQTEESRVTIVPGLFV